MPPPSTHERCCGRCMLGAVAGSEARSQGLVAALGRMSCGVREGQDDVALLLLSARTPASHQSPALAEASPACLEQRAETKRGLVPRTHSPGFCQPPRGRAATERSWLASRTLPLRRLSAGWLQLNNSSGAAAATQPCDFVVFFGMRGLRAVLEEASRRRESGARDAPVNRSICNAKLFTVMRALKRSKGQVLR